MGVYIKGVHKPKSCRRCFFNESDLRCIITGGKIDRDDYECDAPCPMIEVLEPHGDLVDMDVIKIDRNIFKENKVIHAPILIAPILIPAEGK